jgi:hypothetical protein
MARRYFKIFFTVRSFLTLNIGERGGGKQNLLASLNEVIKLPIYEIPYGKN